MIKISKFPILFPSYATEFWGHGRGILSDAISCTVKGELNGAYDLELIYPMGGAHLSDVTGRSIIYAEATPLEGRQPFRVYDIIERSSGRVSILAHHVSYDLGGIPVSEIDAESSDEAFLQLVQNSVVTNGFTFDCQRSVEKSFRTMVPKSARNRLLDSDESILAAYGGEFRFDHFRVEYRNSVGRNKGYRIKYGTNLIDLAQERNFEELYTGIYPYYGSGENRIELPERVVRAEGEFGFWRVKVVNLSSEFSEEPDEELLREHAMRYVSDKKIGVPRVSIDLTHAHLSRFGDFCSAHAPEDVEPGDTVIVEYPKYNITVSARVNSFKYDSISKKYISIGIGDVKSGFIKTLHQLNRSSVAATETRRIANEALSGASGSMATAEEAKKAADDAVTTVEEAKSAAEQAVAAVSDRVKYTELANGGVRIAGIVLPTEGSSEGTLTGVWGATPQAGGDPSRIVTLQDLYNWGILT